MKMNNNSKSKEKKRRPHFWASNRARRCTWVFPIKERAGNLSFFLDCPSQTVDTFPKRKFIILFIPSATFDSASFSISSLCLSPSFALHLSRRIVTCLARPSLPASSGVDIDRSLVYDRTINIHLWPSIAPGLPFEYRQRIINQSK